jgi:hypothetical protein
MTAEGSPASSRKAVLLWAKSITRSVRLVDTVWFSAVPLSAMLAVLGVLRYTTTSRTFEPSKLQLRSTPARSFAERCMCICHRYKI